MLKCSASLWSADLANLASEISRIEPYVERFHIDVADGQYVNTLLFFPDMVRAIRVRTRLPLEVHLITLNPLRWIAPFISAGADSITFYLDTAEDPRQLIRVIKAQGKRAGISLRVEDPVDLLDPFWSELDSVTLVGTHMGVKGVTMDATLPDKIRAARKAIYDRQLATEIHADGGIRYDTVPLIHRAGADFIVPGSLMFNEDPAAVRSFLASL